MKTLKHLIMIFSNRQKKGFILILISLCSIMSAHSQADSLLIEIYNQKIIENNLLELELKDARKKYSELNNTYTRDTLSLKNNIKTLHSEIDIEKKKRRALQVEYNALKSQLQKKDSINKDLELAYQKDNLALHDIILNLNKEINRLNRDFEKEQKKVLKLNKAKTKRERDSLQINIDQLQNKISDLEKISYIKDMKIDSILEQSLINAQEENENGKNEILKIITNSYLNLGFDQLIKMSTKESIKRDIELTSNILETQPILYDLQVYFNAKELLSKKYNKEQLEKASKQLNKINRTSELLDILRNDIKYYEDFNHALIEKIITLIDLDNETTVINRSSQNEKFNIVSTSLIDYMYNYYDYNRYPYLSNIILEIIKRKGINADAEISDLFNDLQ